MSRRTLRAVSRTSPVNRALKEGQVDTGDIAFAWEEVSPLPKAFRRMVREGAWDVTEMALTTFITARAHGVRLTGIPAFLVRDFHHKSIVRAKGVKIAGPKDLEGRRVAVNRGYTVTTGVWARDILFTDYDVDLSQITWARSSDEHVEGWEPPANVEDLGGSGDLEEELKAGRVAAAVGLSPDEGTAPVIADPFEAGMAALKHDGLWPINHLVVIRDEVLDQTPGLARAVFDAFAAAKSSYLDDLKGGRVTDPGPVESLHLAVMDVLDDPVPFGIAPNLGMLERLMKAAVSQGIVAEAIPLDDLFAPEVRDVVA